MALVPIRLRNARTQDTEIMRSRPAQTVPVRHGRRKVKIRTPSTSTVNYALRMPVDVGVTALTTSHRLHRDSAAKLNGPSAALLLFYAAECGLKAIYMRRQGLDNTAKLDARARSHDLRHLAKELRLSQATVKKLLHYCRAHRDRSVTIDIADWHQAWRYGKLIEPSDETEALACLDALVTWCRTEIRS